MPYYPPQTACDQRRIDAFYDAAQVVENNSIPLGNDYYYALRLGSDGNAELAIKEYHGYTFEQELHLIVRGKWELRERWAERFAIQFIDPLFEVVQEGPGIHSYIKRFQAKEHWVVGNE